MAEIVILVDKFYSIRKLMLDRKYRINRQNTFPARDNATKYRRQQRARLDRQNLMKNDPRFGEFFAWVFSLQRRLKLNDRKFAILCGVSPQMVKLWRNYDRGCGGYFPSEKTFKILLRLEVVAQAKIRVKKNKLNIKNARFPTTRVQLPRLKRLQANVPY